MVVPCLVWPSLAGAQDLEPRRWTHLPVGSNVGGVTFGYTEGDLLIDPAFDIENADVTTYLVVASYVRTFGLFGKTGRVDLIVPWADATWEGEISGTTASTSRTGFDDPWIRLSVNIKGAPPLKGEEYMAYRAANPVQTVIGTGIAVQLPLGEYMEDKSLNLGENRFIFRPQLGVVHTRGSWSYEVTGSVDFFTENDDFISGSERTQDPLYTLQGHVIHSFPNRFWASLSAGYRWGGESEVDGTPLDDERGDLLWAVSTGLPVGKTQGVKLVYVRGDTQEQVGTDTNSLVLSWTMRF